VSVRQQVSMFIKLVNERTKHNNTNRQTAMAIKTLTQKQIKYICMHLERGI